MREVIGVRPQDHVVDRRTGEEGKAGDIKNITLGKHRQDADTSRKELERLKAKLALAGIDPAELPDVLDRPEVVRGSGERSPLKPQTPLKASSSTDTDLEKKQREEEERLEKAIDQERDATKKQKLREELAAKIAEREKAEKLRDKKLEEQAELDRIEREKTEKAVAEKEKAKNK